MNNNFSNFSDVLKAAIEFGGKEILKDKRKTSNYLEDLAPGNKFQKEKKLLNDAYSCNAVNILLDADTSPDKRKKAVDSAKNKLMDSMSLSESGSDLILKEICAALGWNTKQLFTDSSSQEKVQPAIPKENKNVSLNKEYYNQPVINAEPINNNKPVVYSNQVPITANTQTAKKKSPFGTLLKVAAVIIVVCVIYNLGKNDGNSDTVIIDETQTTVSESTFSETYLKTTAVAASTEAVTTTEPVNNEAFTNAGSEQAYNENVAEAALIVSDLTVETTSEITTQEVTTADPRTGKYVVTDIARFEYSEYLKYDRFMAYDSNENAVYYVTDTDDVHKYNLYDQSDTTVITLSEIIEKMVGSTSNENSLIQKNSDIDVSGFGIDGVVFNDYSKKSYVYAHGKMSFNTDLYFYDINEDSLIEFKDKGFIRTLSFINKDEFFVPYSDSNSAGYIWMLYNIYNDNSKRIKSGINFYRIVDVNDNYYGIMPDGDVRKFSNVYNAESEKLFSVEPAGADVNNNILYYKDWENNVYKIDLDNLTEELYISVDDIFQNGKQFLGNGKCSGLYMTNDGGFITYDKSDSKLKYVSMNK